MSDFLVQSLFEAEKYLDALQELRSWPNSLEKDACKGACLFWLGRYEESESVYARLSAIPGAPPDVFLRLAISLQAQSRHVEALSSLLSCLRCARESDSAPKFEDLLIQYGNICLEIGLASHFLALASRFPTLLDSSSGLRFLRGISFFFIGFFEAGWTDNEFRPGQDLPKLLGFKLPLISQANLSECSNLLIVVEPLSGFGDVFWMFRYFWYLHSAGHRLSFLGPQDLVSFIASTGLFVEVASCIRDMEDSPSHWLPILSLPGFVGLFEPAQLPSPNLQLAFPAPRLVIQEVSRDDCSRKPLIALNWQGNLKAETLYSMGIRGRSFSINDLEAIDALRHCSVLSVQHGDAARQIHDSWLHTFLHPLQAALDSSCRDFLMTAEALSCVDILITNDTSIAHLGGLLGVHTLLILKCHPYWQWGDSSRHCVWYPSIRCFRQKSPGDWSSAMQDVNYYLTGYLQSKGFILIEEYT